ncbi:MAG: hypothetical protein ACFHWX_05115 [Bacteroidota bacterium]
MRNIGFWFIILIFFTQCGQKDYYQVNVDNPPYRENTAFNAYEDLSSPKFQQLRTRYQLDTIFQGETDEFQRILLIKEWIHQIIPIDDHGDPYPGGGYVEGILDAALNGTGFHCGHFMNVQNGILNAYGYVTRTLGAGPGEAGVADSHHGINETWVNSLNKWVLLDAKYNHYFEKDGIPLSALEVREEYLKNKAADIQILKGIERVPVEFDETFQRDKASFARTYTWIEFDTNNNFFTVWPEFKTLLTMYADDYFNNNTWIWDGKPHWAYSKPEFMIREPNRSAIEWTPNTIASKVEIGGNNAMIYLVSDTPNFLEYQMKINDREWEKVSDVITVPLSEDKYEIRFRTINLANVAGPEHRVLIMAK